MSTPGHGRAWHLAKFVGLVDDRPKPKARQLLRAFWRTLPYIAVAAVLGATVELLGAPSWAHLVLLVAPVVVMTILLEQERER